MQSPNQERTRIEACPYCDAELPFHYGFPNHWRISCSKNPGLRDTIKSAAEGGAPNR